MSAYRPYPKYKPSGVEWLGEVPEHWKVAPFKWQIDRNDGGVWGDDPDGTNDTIVLRSTEQSVNGHWKLDDPAPRKLSKSEINAALLIEGDLLFTKSSGSSLHIGKTTLVTAEIEAMRCCYSNFMQRIRTAKTFTPELAWYVLNNDLARLQFDILSNSSTGLANLNGTMVGQIIVPVAPISEQHQIADFLDRECGKLDALQAKQERLIELLKEKRQALISHAVTRGLDPTAKLKPSGIEWLGDVPEHWKLVSFGQCVAITGGQVDPTVEPFLNYVMIAPNHIESKMGNILALETATEQGAESGKYLCKKGDVIYSKIRPALAKACLCPQDQVLCSADMYPMRGMLGLTNEFLLKVLLTAEFTAFAIMESDRVAMPKLNRETLATTRLPIPPLAEQRAIVAHLDEKCGKIDQLKAKAERGIELLKERRSALISAAVTGKIDVRESLKQTSPA